MSQAVLMPSAGAPDLLTTSRNMRHQPYGSVFLAIHSDNGLSLMLSLQAYIIMKVVYRTTAMVKDDVSLLGSTTSQNQLCLADSLWLFGCSITI